MATRSIEPLLWSLFSAGDVIAAMVLPVLILLFGIAFPLYSLTPPPHEYLQSVLGHPLTRIGAFVTRSRRGATPSPTRSSTAITATLAGGRISRERFKL